MLDPTSNHKMEKQQSMYIYNVRVYIYIYMGENPKLKYRKDQELPLVIQVCRVELESRTIDARILKKQSMEDDDDGGGDVRP